MPIARTVAALLMLTAVTGCTGDPGPPDPPPSTAPSTASEPDPVGAAAGALALGHLAPETRSTG